MALSTVTITNVSNYAAQHTDLMPMSGIGGIANEPALSLANDTMNELLGEHFPWKFNRAEMAVFVTAPNKQDYKFAGAAAFSQTLGGVGIDLTTNSGITQSGSTVTVKVLESCLNILAAGDTVFLAGITQTAIKAVYTPGQGNSGVTAWSNGFAIATVATDGLSFTFTYAPVISTDGAPGITNFGWMENATMTLTASTQAVPFVYYLAAVRNLRPNSFTGIPGKISLIEDLGTGVLRLRLICTPGTQPFTISVVYQKKPVLKTALSDTWTPVPDNYIHVVRQMFLAMAYRLSESPKEPEEFQKARALSAELCDTDDREDSDEFITPGESLVAGYGYGNGIFS